MSRADKRSLPALLTVLLVWVVVGCGTGGRPATSATPTPIGAETTPAVFALQTPANSVTPVVTPPPTIAPKPSELPVATLAEKPVQPTSTATRQPTATPLPPTATHPLEVDSTPQPTPAPRSQPRLIIPALNVDAVVIPVGLDANGAMAAPDDWFEVGWFRYGPRPGFAGSAALAGHLDTNTGAPATFWDLDKLAPGQEIIYQTENGSRLTFVVDEIATYPWDQVPLDRVFARSGDPRLSLITCGGAWSREHRNYSHRTIAYASLR